MFPVEALLKPVIGLPEIRIRPVDPVFFQVQPVLLVAAEVFNQVKKIRQVFLTDIKKIVGIGADKTLDEIGPVPGVIRQFVP